MAPWLTDRQGFFLRAEDGIRGFFLSRGLGDVNKSQREGLRDGSFRRGGRSQGPQRAQERDGSFSCGHGGHGGYGGGAAWSQGPQRALAVNHI